MSKIVLIGIVLLLVWIRLMLPFIRAKIISDKSLEDNPINERFHVILETLDREIFSGNSTVTVYDENREYMQMTGDNDFGVSYVFMYSTMNLTVQILFGEGSGQQMVEKTFNRVENVSDSVQNSIAKLIVDETRNKAPEERQRENRK